MSAIPHSPAPWNAPPPNYETQFTATTLTPYLQLPHLLSLTWLAYPILSLVFVAFRLQLSLAASQDAVANAKDDLLASCNAAEQAATSAASMPRVMAVVTNEQFVDAVNSTIDGARFVLTTSLTVMEAIINFIIDLYRSTLLCFLELVVHGGLSVLIGAVQEANSLLQSTASSLRTSIQSDIGSANTVITNFVNGVNKVNPFSKIQAPQITVPSLDSLANLTFPSSFQDALTQLNASIPSVAALKNEIDSIIDTPFELLKKDINDTFAQISFNSSIMPVPAQNRLSFCGDVDLSVVDDIGQDLIKTAWIGTIILILIALALIGLNCLLTWYKWRCMKAHLEYTRQAWNTDPTMYHTKTSGVPHLSLTDHNLLILQANSSHPLLTRIANRLSQLLHLTPSQHTHLQWFFHYIFHPPAVAVFLIGLFGLLSVELQLLAMRPLEAKFQDRAAATVSDLSNTITTSINNSMYNQSAAYANEVNTRVNTVQNIINDGLFGWVNQTTTSLNTTVNNFYSDIENAVNTVFGGTILEQPAQDFISCFIGSKVDAIENVLTFLHNNLNIDMPQMNQSVLVLSPDLVNEAVQPIAAAAIGGGTDDNSGLIGKLVNSYAESLKNERIMFCVFLGLWGVVVLIGLAIIFWHSYGRQMAENWRRKRQANGGRQGINDEALPPRGTSNDSVDRTSWTARNQELVVESKVNLEESWDIPSVRNQPNQHAEQKRGFIAVAKERLIPRKAPPTFAPAEEKRRTAWPSRMATLLGRKDQHGSTIRDLGIGNPELKSTSNEFANALQTIDDKPQEVIINEPSSRWSSTTGALSPGNEVVSSSPPTVPSIPPPKSSSQNSPGLGPSTRPVISFPRPIQPKHTGNVSVASKHNEEPHGGVIAQPRSHLQPISMPMPLHHGFENEHSKYPVTSSQQRSRQAPPPPVSLNNAGAAQRHRRSVSFSAVERADMGGIGAGGNIISNATERHLTGSQVPYGRQQGMLANPFISPFDDEYKVEIQQPAVTRKSMLTDPFEGRAV